MADEDYEIMSHKDILKLKEEVEKLKKNPFGDSSSGSSFMDTVGRLEVSMNSMLEIFRMAYSDFKNEDDIIVKKMDPFFEKLNRVIDQNEKIAEALVAIADMLKEMKIRMDAANQMNSQRQMPGQMSPPPMYPPSQPPVYPGMGPSGNDFPPMGSMNPPMPGQDQFNPLPAMGAMPPPPGPQFPDKQKKKGFFGK